jgi:hypothetical protein
MGCFEAKTDEDVGGGGHERAMNENQNYQDGPLNLEEEEFEDFKELGSKSIKNYY